MRGPDVLDLPRPAVIGVHDLHRRRARRRLHRAHIGHPATLEPRASAQIRMRKPANPQVTALATSETPKREPSQVSGEAVAEGTTEGELQALLGTLASPLLAVLQGSETEGYRVTSSATVARLRIEILARQISASEP